MKEDVDGGGLSKISAQDAECPDKSPAVRVELGGGNVDLCQEFPFERREGQAHPNAFEDRLIKEEEGDPVIGPLISTHGLAWDAGEHSNIFVVPPSEDTMLIDS